MGVDLLNVRGLQAMEPGAPVVMVNLMRFRERSLDGDGSYIRTIACDQRRSDGTSVEASPTSSAITSTGSGSAYSPMTSKDAGSTSSSNEAASAWTRGRSRST